MRTIWSRIFLFNLSSLFIWLLKWNYKIITGKSKFQKNSQNWPAIMGKKWCEWRVELYWNKKYRSVQEWTLLLFSRSEKLIFPKKTWMSVLNPFLIHWFFNIFMIYTQYSTDNSINVWNGFENDEVKYIVNLINLGKIHDFSVHYNNLWNFIISRIIDPNNPKYNLLFIFQNFQNNNLISFWKRSTWICKFQRRLRLLK